MTYTDDRRNLGQVSEQHLSEWVDGSGVSETISRLNVRSFVTLDKAEKVELCRLLNYKAWEKGFWNAGSGWLVQGINPDTGMRTTNGLQFKFDNPKPNKDGKVAKYKGANDSDSAPLFLDVGNPEFWKRVKADRTIPIIWTEGAKKAGAVLSYGYNADTDAIDFACISLPGVWNWQKEGTPKAFLSEWAGDGRDNLLAFDMDAYTNPHVLKALIRFGGAILNAGGQCKVMKWDESRKGIDDLIVAEGHPALKTAIRTAQPYGPWSKLASEQLNSSKKKNLSFYQKVVEALYGEGHWICVDDTLYKWTGTYYEQCERAVELRRITEYCDTLEVEKEDKDGNIVIEYPYASPGYPTKAYEWVRMRLGVDPKKINPPGINCSNGVVQITYRNEGDAKNPYIVPSWELEPHSPDRYYLIKPYFAYDPKADPTYCNRLLEALEPKEREIFLKTIAASIDMKQVRKKHSRIRALLAIGEGSNGKDTLRETASLLFGRQGMTGVSFDDFAQYDKGRKFPLKSLEFARISWSSENSSYANLDNLQSLKQVITGDPISFEGKRIDERQGDPNCVLIFNCNKAPQIQGSLEAIKSRFAPLTFRKTFKMNADPNRGELEADPRFKGDLSFIQQHVLPAFLNRVLQALYSLMTDGIDYSSTNEAFETIRDESCHLWKFCKEAGLGYNPNGSVYPKQIWERLQEYYAQEGTITYDDNNKAHWEDQPNPRDKNVKGMNQVYARFLELFPKAKRGTRDRLGVPILGISFGVDIDIPSSRSSPSTPSCEPVANQCEPVCEPMKPSQDKDSSGLCEPVNQTTGGVPSNSQPAPPPPDPVLQIGDESTENLSAKTEKTNSDESVLATASQNQSKPSQGKDSTGSQLVHTGSQEKESTPVEPNSSNGSSDQVPNSEIASQQCELLHALKKGDKIQSSKWGECVVDQVDLEIGVVFASYNDGDSYGPIYPNEITEA